MKTPFELLWLCKPHSDVVAHDATFKEKNPTIKSYVTYGENCNVEGHSRWRNCDRNIREWWKSHRHEVSTEMVVTAEYDVVINCNLSNILELRQGVGCRNTVDSKSNWYWFKETPKLGHLQKHATGFALLSLLVWHRDALDAICDPKYDEIFGKDIFCELRLATVLTDSSQDIYQLSYAQNVLTTWQHKTKKPKWDITSEGIYHPVKLSYLKEIPIAKIEPIDKFTPINVSTKKSGRKIIFVAWDSAFFRNQLETLMNFHKKMGDFVTFTHYRAENLMDLASVADTAYLWNGAYPGICQSLISKLKNQGAQIIYTEIGWFPQSKYLYFDYAGTNGNSELFFDPLLWLDQEDMNNLRTKREEYRENYTLADQGYIFVPLQLPSDQQMQQWSPYKWMGQFIIDTRRRFAGKNVIFRRHPKDGKRYDDLDVGDDGEGDLKKLICGASMVYGINSTVLLEAALIGKPVIAIGKSLLTIGASRDQALAALLAKQVPANTLDFSPWMRPGRGLEHLNWR